MPLGVTRTYVKSVDVGVFPQARRAFQVTRCNQCDAAPCVTACPTGAMFARRDGIVDFDKSICIGCKACIAACPYDAIFMNPEDHAAEKCNFCAHRLDVGLEPACVVVCPTEAILVGDLNDPSSRVAQMVHRERRRGAPAREGHASEALLSRRARGDARSAGRAPAGRRALHVERAGCGRRPVRRRGAVEQHVRRGAPQLRRAPRGALALARQPLHVDERDRRGRVSGARRPRARRRALVDERRCGCGCAPVARRRGSSRRPAAS